MVTRSLRLVVALLLLIPLTALLTAAATLPGDFQEQALPFQGLSYPSNVAFSPDGRVFVTEKSGLIKVFSSIGDTSSGKVFADLRPEVYDYLDRGLLGIALPPGFPTDARVFVLYSEDAPVGGVPPVYNDTCSNTDGCVVGARLAVLSDPANPTDGLRDSTPASLTEKVLVEDWCQQYSSHSIGTLLFGADGYLYAGGGDGASFTAVDYGQAGNPCADPPGKAGTSLTAPSAEGGALRAQDLRTTGDPTTLDGGIIRIDPDTGAAAPTNPYATTGHDDNAKRLIAEGLRNPYRFTVRPGTDEVWAGQVGWNTWEAIDRIGDPTKFTNFGWPCYEGNARQPGYDGANLTLCEKLYSSAGAVTAPYYAYQHSAHVVAGDPCVAGNGASLSGLAFYGGGAYPAKYDKALFFTDYSRKCTWAMLPGSNGLPDPAKIEVFASGGSGLVQLTTGPGGDLYGVDLVGSKIVRYVYTAGNNAPSAAIKADPAKGPLPLTVNLDATASTDADHDPLSYAWDFGDGTWVAGGATATHTYTTKGKVTVRVKVSDGNGGEDVASTVITPGTAPPSVQIDSPGPGTTWKVGDTIAFSGHATDASGAPIPAAGLSWQLLLHHCPGGSCHTHVLQSSTGASGTVTTPDHDYPSWLELQLTATDSDGITAQDSLRLDPQTAKVTVTSNPAGVWVGTSDLQSNKPISVQAIVGSHFTVTVPYPSAAEGPDQIFDFTGWSDGGAATHQVTVPAAGVTVTAGFKARTNLALKRPVKSSSNQVTGSTTLWPKYAVDGDIRTRWSSKYSSPQWIKVDLGSTKTIRRVLLDWERAYGKSYRIDVSTNNSTWTTVYSTTTGNGGLDDITVKAVKARWVRMYGRHRATNWGYSIWTFGVYAT